jgi:hypothetical protein
MARLLATFVFALASAGCIGALTPGSKLQETSSTMNTDVQFGRSELAIEQVLPTAREEWSKNHKAWGTAIRITDSEVAGMHLVDASHGEVTLKVNWCFTDQQELRVTTVKQKWKDISTATGGGWMLASEERVDGDAGLLGDFVPPPEAASAPQAKTVLPTIRLGTPDEAPGYYP